MKKTGILLCLELLRDCTKEDQEFVRNSSKNDRHWEIDETIDRIDEIVESYKNEIESEDL